MKKILYLPLFIYSIGIIGCSDNSQNWISQRSATFKKFLLDWGGSSGSSPMPSPSTTSAEFQSLDTPQERNNQYKSEAAKQAKENREILQEIFQVVFMREPKDRAEFGNWVDTLNQGASLEGVYNGLTHSSEYRKLEIISPSAAADALRIFGEELADLELELPNRTDFDLASASPPDVAVIPSPSAALLAEKYSKKFVGSSIFILKRILADEALKVVAIKSEYREKMASWYSKWVVKMCQRNVDFGISLRNKADEAFHYKWALGTTEDRIKWEILNRIHRVLNEANKLKQ